MDHHAANLIDGRGKRQKKSREFAVRRNARPANVQLTLAGFEAAVRLVDHVDAALAAHDAVVAMPRAQGLEGVSNFHHDTG